MQSIDENIQIKDSLKPVSEHISKSWFRRIVMHVSRLADSEIELVKAESLEKLREVKRKTNLLIIAYLFLFSGMISLGAALVHVLSTQIPPWLTLAGLGGVSLVTGLCVLKTQK